MQYTPEQLSPDVRLRLLYELMCSVEVAEQDIDLTIHSTRRYNLLLPPLAQIGLGLYDPVLETALYQPNSVIKKVALPGVCEFALNNFMYSGCGAGVALE